MPQGDPRKSRAGIRTRMPKPISAATKCRGGMEKTKYKKTSGCGAVGSARRLGASYRHSATQNEKRRKALKTLSFLRLIDFDIVLEKRFDHRFDHLQKSNEKSNIFTLRGVAQLVAREVWDFDAVGSNPATPTKIGFGKQFPKPLLCLLQTKN